MSQAPDPTSGSAPSVGAPAEPTDRDRFGRLVLAEWTKVRSVPRWLMTMAAAVGLTVLIAFLTASGNSVSSEEADVGPTGDVDTGGDVASGGGADLTDPELTEPSAGPGVLDEFHFVHQPLTGDGSVVVRVVSQESSHEWAKAGVLLKEDLEWGAPYAALMVTPEHGVRLQSEFGGTDLAGSDETAPRWLRLTRSGDSVTGSESDDGSSWSKLGTVDFDALPQTVEVGMFVTSPVEVEVERQFGSESVGSRPTLGEATFDNVTVESEAAPRTARDEAWSDHDASMLPDMGGSSQVGGVFTVRGSGDIGEDDSQSLFGDDLVEMSLQGAVTGLLLVVALGVLFITAEHKRGMIGSTLVAIPRRKRMLAAKAAVIGGVTFVLGLVASAASFLVAQPILRDNGFGPPEFPERSLSELSTLQAVVGTAALFALVAVLSLAAGAIARRSAAAITTVVVLLVFPLMIQDGLPLSTAQWLTRLTPSAGFAVQQTAERYDTAIAPLAGLAVLGTYTAVAFGTALWLLDRRDA